VIHGPGRLLWAILIICNVSLFQPHAVFPRIGEHRCER
jgi:hypothetical protein